MISATVTSCHEMPNFIKLFCTWCGQDNKFVDLTNHRIPNKWIEDSDVYFYLQYQF